MTKQGKMEKLKIVNVSSEAYPKGRIDSFTIPKCNRIADNYVIPLFRELGFIEESLDDLDLDFENKPAGNYFFSYGNNNIKAMIVIGEKKISIVFDTNLDKNKINEIIEKYFEFPEQ